MTAKEYLRSYGQLNRRVLRLKAEYTKEEELIDSVRSTLGGDGMPHGSGVSKPTEDRAIRLADKRMEWVRAELEAIEKRQEIFELINGIDGTEGDILYERYINLRKWEEICVLVHMSWRQVHRLHAKGLREVESRMA